jgi:hypothetical protein
MEVGIGKRDHPQCFLALSCLERSIPSVAEHASEHSSDDILILDDEDDARRSG